jgi:hypothetical protein
MAKLEWICLTGGKNENEKLDARQRAGDAHADWESCLGSRKREGGTARATTNTEMQTIKQHIIMSITIRTPFGDGMTRMRSTFPPAKKDRLPPGLEKQLVRRGTLPPGLQKRIQPCPEELERRLPPPPPDCVNVFIGGHIVLLNKKTNVVVDIFHFEIH